MANNGQPMPLSPSPTGTSLIAETKSFQRLCMGTSKAAATTFWVYKATRNARGLKPPSSQRTSQPSNEIAKCHRAHAQVVCPLRQYLLGDERLPLHRKPECIECCTGIVGWRRHRKPEHIGRDTGIVGWRGRSHLGPELEGASTRVNVHMRLANSKSWVRASNVHHQLPPLLRGQHTWHLTMGTKEKFRFHWWSTRKARSWQPVPHPTSHTEQAHRWRSSRQRKNTKPAPGTHMALHGFVCRLASIQGFTRRSF